VVQEIKKLRAELKLFPFAHMSLERENFKIIHLIKVENSPKMPVGVGMVMPIEGR
jgi:hypothetical protein